LEFREQLETLESGEQLDGVDHQVQLGRPGRLDLRETLDHRECRGQLVQLVLRELRDPKGHKVNRVKTGLSGFLERLGF